MRQLLIVVVGLILGLASRPAKAMELFEAPYASRSQVSAELFGAGLFYSIYGSYRLTPNIPLNIGLSYLHFNSSDPIKTAGSVSALCIPISISYLIGDYSNFLEVVGGLTLAFPSGKTEVLLDNDIKQSIAHQIVVPEIGVGYRYWPKHGGIHFRAIAYLIVGSSATIPWGGVSLGYAL